MDYVECVSSVMNVGDRYGRYTVVGIFRAAHGYQKYAKVVCDCGSAPRMVQIGTLRNGESKSCGCFHKEQITKHGAWNTPIFRTWRMMIDRCQNPLNKRYARYGGRGITVCERWQSFSNFRSDMEHSYVPGLTLDRIDNNQSYSPDNCRWATRAQQNRNCSRNIVITHEGKTMCLRDWADALNLNYGTLHDRIKIQGLSFHDAISR